MKLSVYTSGDFPYGDAAANYIRMMAKGFVALGFKVDVICTRGFWYSGNSQKSLQGIKRRNLFLRYKPANYFFKIIEFLGIIFTLPISLIRDVCFKRTELIFIYGIDYPYYTFWFILFRYFTKTRFVRIIADSYEKTNLAPYKVLNFKYYLYLLQKKYFDNHFHFILCFSVFLKGEQSKYGRSAHKLILIPHFIDFNTKQFPLFNKGLKPEPKKICYAGSFSRRNGIFYLLDAFLLLSKITKEPLQLVLVGSSDSMPKTDKRLFDNITENLIKNDLLVVTGKVSYEKVIGYLKACDVLVNPRQKSIESEAGFPTKIGEYLSVSKPAVSTNTGDIPYYFSEDDMIKIADVDSFEDFSQKILCLLNNPEDAKKCAIKGYIWGVDNLDYLRNAKKLIKYILNT